MTSLVSTAVPIHYLTDEKALVSGEAFWKVHMVKVVGVSLSLG